MSEMHENKKTSIITNKNTENQPSKRNRQEYSANRYQLKKQEYHNWYLKRKQQKAAQKEQQAQLLQERNKRYYGAESIKVLISLKEYTELDKDTRKLWLDFNKTFKDLNKIGINNIIEIMRLNELADILINDYWKTAKQIKTDKIKHWNLLTTEQQNKLIRYWVKIKVQQEQSFNIYQELLDKEAITNEKELSQQIEILKHHEQRGLKGCKCWHCQDSNIKEKTPKPKRKNNRRITTLDNELS